MRNILNFKYSNLLGVVGPIAIINVLLALIALFKDMLLASYLGTNEIADAFALAFFITDMVGNNIIANTIGTTSIPIFSKIYVIKDYKLLHRCVVRIIGYSVIFTLLLCVLMFVFKAELIGAGFTNEATKLCIMLFTILLPTIIFYPIMLIFVSYLQVHNKYIISSLMPVLFNLIFFIGVGYCSFNRINPLNGTYIISYFLLVALISVIFIMFIYVKRINDKEDFYSKEDFVKDTDNNLNSLILEIINLSVPFLFIIIFSQGILYFERRVASGFSNGSVSALNYSYRLSQFPIWVFISAISTVFFPSISKLIHNNSEEKAREGLLKVIFFTISFIMPIMLMLFILKEPIISILFLRGSFDNSSLLITLKIFSTYCFVIIGQSLTNVCIKYFLAIKDTKTPITILFTTFVINIIIDIYASRYIGLYALGLGAAIGSFLSTILILNRLKLNLFRRYNYKIMYVVVGNLMFSCILLLSLNLYINNFLYSSLISKVLFMAISVCISSVIYIYVLYRNRVF